LLRSALGVERFGARIEAIAGAPPLLTAPSVGCAFTSRCSLVQDRCLAARPVLAAAAGRLVACHRADEIAAAAPEPLADAVSDDNDERARHQA
jgi:oligopeptide/dipeptide ABC transporter ATP-binding protein